MYFNTKNAFLISSALRQIIKKANSIEKWSQWIQLREELLKCYTNSRKKSHSHTSCPTAEDIQKLRFFCALSGSERLKSVETPSKLLTKKHLLY